MILVSTCVVHWESLALNDPMYAVKSDGFALLFLSEPMITESAHDTRKPLTVRSLLETLLEIGMSKC